MEIRNSLLYGIGFLIIAISIAFYSFFYLPNVGQNQLKLADQQRTADNEAKVERIRQLKICLAEADSSYLSAWNSGCKAGKKEDNCSLAGDKAQRLELYKSDEKDFCFKLYD